MNSCCLESLNASHDRAAFNCGTEALNRFLQQVARQHSERSIARTYVLVDEKAIPPKPILGFFALSACEVESENFPPAVGKKLPRKVPAARLGRLAVSKDHQGKGFGAALLIAAFKKMVLASELVGMSALFVDAKDEHAAAFYRHYGFVPLHSHPLTLFLMREDVEKTVASTQAQGADRTYG